MKCEHCDQQATVHSLIHVGGIRQEVHLCRQCAEKRKLITSENKPDLPAVVSQMVGKVGLFTSDLAKLQCPDCGAKYMDIRRSGRLGCPYDYVVFREGLRPLLDRVHRATVHVGKRPKRLDACIEAHEDLRQLRFQLKQAVDAEDFESAARLRDLIRTKGNEDDP